MGALGVYHPAMRHGWVYIYESPPATKRFEELVEHLAMDGIVLANPATDVVMRLSPIGEDIPSSFQGILEELEKSKVVPFNFYLDSSTNVFCSIDKLNRKIVRESYGLDGKTEPESWRVIESLISIFRKRTLDRVAFGFVADRNAELHRFFEWNDFFLRSVVPPEWPLVLGFSSNFANLDVIPCGLYRREENDNCVLFRLADSAAR